VSEILTDLEDEAGNFRIRNLATSGCGITSGDMEDSLKFGASTR
jgi:hypothetical protein